MKKTITVRGLTIGEGIPKVCVPMVSEDLIRLKEEAALLKTLEPDIVEWRADFFAEVNNLAKVKEALNEIRTILNDIPLIFTFRSAREGGQIELATDYYFELNKKIAATGLVDIIDVELVYDENEIKSLIESAHKHNVFVIISNHDFEKTPPKDEMIRRLRKAQQLGGDIPKIAVMPKNSTDVLTLLDAANTMKEKYADRPIITMSMSGKGVISRLAGELFGSALTFGAARKASAPGQIDSQELIRILKLIHTNYSN